MITFRPKQAIEMDLFKHIKVIADIDYHNLDEREARHYINFLEEEKVRHTIAAKVNDHKRYIFRTIPTLKVAYELLLTHHLDSIQYIQRIIDDLKKNMRYKQEVFIWKVKNQQKI